MRSSELQRIRGLSEIFASRSADVAAATGARSADVAAATGARSADGTPGRVIVGIGDDAAVLAGCAEPLVWTIDAAVEGVHFRRAWLSFEDIGFRSTMAAVSDLGAMGAEPLGVLSALILPDDVSDEALFAIARGQREAAEICGTLVIGGNLARGRELSITTTALGRSPGQARALTRSGAKPGDGLWLLGPVGLAAAGLRWLQSRGGAAGVPEGVEPGAGLPESAELRACVEAWRRPRARIAEGLSLRGVASAAVDVSDGLARDVGHVARASGVIVVIEASVFDDAIDDASDPLARSILRGASAALARARPPLGDGVPTLREPLGDGVPTLREPLGDGVPTLRALDLALFGGEDYAIAFTSEAGESVPGAVRVGSVEAPGDRAPGVFVRENKGSLRALDERGFDHFASG